MSLPKQVLPIYTLKVPSTGKTVKFRQFTVKEEKAMILAKESEDVEVITNAVVEVIKSCVTGIEDVNALALFDIEYIITRLRAKSVSERIDLKMLCDVDEEHEKIPVMIDIEKIEVKFPEGHSKEIPLYDDVGIVMKYPSIGLMSSIGKMDGLELMLECIDYIYTKEEVYHAKDSTKEELLEFLNNLTQKQLDKIQETFFDKMPTYSHEVQYKCRECGHEHVKTIRGLASFFA